MAKKYIFMTGKYMPTPGATGVCIHALAKYLASQGDDVSTICYEDNSGKSNIDGVKVYRIKAPSYFYDKQYYSKYEQIKDVWTSRFMKLVHLKQYPLRSRSLLKSFKNKCIELAKDTKQSDVTIIASYTPLEAVASLIEIKKELPETKIVYYSTDTLSNEQGNSGILSAEKREQMGYKWEKTIFNNCDLILIMECHKNHYFNQSFFSDTKKMYLVNFPLLNKPKNISNEVKNTIVYAGTLLRELRNPIVTCNTLLDILPHLEYDVLFMGSGDCDDIINDAVEKSNGKMKYLGMQPYEVASNYIATAGVLLSIGNAESPMAPSKIYEYMATGKPIIHFFSWDRDPCLQPLKEYGNALLIDEKKPIVKDEIILFLNNRVLLEYEVVEKRFLTSTPEYTAKLICRE